MDLEQFLDEIGLGAYERRAYVALLRLGRSKSKPICRESGVSYGRIYEILERLEERGLVSVLPTEPKTFEAIEPKLALKRAVRKETDRYKLLEQAVAKLTIPATRIPQATHGERTIVLHGYQKQMEMLREMNDRAKQEILTIPGVYEPPTSNLTITRRALGRGVKIRMLLRAVTPSNRTIIKENIKLGQEVRQRELVGLRLKIVDRKEALLTIIDDTGTKDRISIYTSNKDFAKSMALFFDSLWQRSRPVTL